MYDNKKPYGKKPYGGRSERRARYHNAPYNFAALSDRVYARYGSPAELPSHGEIPQGGRMSGAIALTFTAETPVCIANGRRDADNDFIRNAAGKYVLPGSTLKGLVRSNMLILGCGVMRPGSEFDDYTPLYREMSAGRDTLREPLKGDYQQALGIRGGGRPNVTACYLRREGGRYRIVEASGPFCAIPLRIVPADRQPEYERLCREESRRQGRKLRPYEYSKIKREHRLTILNPVCKWLANQGRYPDARDIPVWYQVRNGEVTRLVSPDRPHDGMKPGVLVCTGQMQSKNSMYLFPAPADSEGELWSKADQLNYEMDYKARYNSLGGTGQEKMDKGFWALPDEAYMRANPWGKPFFRLALDNGSNVLGKSPYLRLTHYNSIADGLPEAHRRAARVEPIFLDYPAAMLGFATPRASYRSRVSFGDLELEGEGKTQDKTTILGEPKPTSFADYLMDGADYNMEEFFLRGVKQYWMHGPNAPDASGNMATTLKLLPEGSKFSGVVRFHNLSEDELGLLLWCLKLDEGCRQSVGKGKPYGYGRMRVSIDAVTRDVPEAMYGADQLDGGVSLTAPLDADALIAAYHRHINQWLKGDIRKLTGVADFMTMRRVVRRAEDVRYMQLSEYRNRTVEEILPTVSEQT